MPAADQWKLALMLELCAPPARKASPLFLKSFTFIAMVREEHGPYHSYIAFFLFNSYRQISNVKPK